MKSELRRRGLGLLISDRLPKEYQEVAYLESTNAYPNTSLCRIDVLNVNINVQDLIIRGKVSNWIDTGRGNGEYCIGTDTKWRFLTSVNRFVAGVDGGNVFCGQLISNDFVFEITNTYITIDGQRYQLPNGSSDITQRITLFSCAKLRLHYLEVYDGKRLAIHLLPCYRKSDNEPGLYDAVNDVFYSNVYSGTFIVGSDITHRGGVSSS